ncbi:MAG TPA: aspartate kinase [Ktedonobacterales bacterium]|nr:aspartate kinase [Ktedonobacterales bacterium]
MIVVKFGGTSLAGVERMRAAARIVAAHQRRDQMVVCVVSAMAGVTDALIRIGEHAAQGDPERRLTTTALRAQHLTALTALTTTTAATTAETLPPFEAIWSALEADLALLASSRGATGPDTRDAQTAAIARFSTWGERLSALLFTAALRAEGVEAATFEGEPVIVSARREHEPMEVGAGSWAHLESSLPATYAALAPQVAQAAARGAALVAPGYLARSDAGEVITLGRNGSDASAALIAAALRASAVYLYSDVAGIYRADPHVVPQADLLPTLTYGDAAALARLGARVLHPAAVRPLADHDIPLYLRSALAPAQPGTLIASARRLHALGAHDVTAPVWAITAQLALASDTLLGLREGATSDSEVVMVTCPLLDHADDDVEEEAAPGRRFQLIVPANKAAAAQRELYAVLRHLDQHNALLGLMRMTPALHTMEVR